MKISFLLEFLKLYLANENKLFIRVLKLFSVDVNKLWDKLLFVDENMLFVRVS